MVNGEIKGLPKAKEMLELQWDNSLEEEAQRYYSNFFSTKVVQLILNSHKIWLELDFYSDGQQF